jgi:hypothetical protein
LSDSAETTVLNTLSVKLNSVLGELETLLDKRSQLADAATFLSENVLGVGGTDDDSMRIQKRKYLNRLSVGIGTGFVKCQINLLGAGRGNTDLNTRVTIFGELTSEELVKFSVEDTVSDLNNTMLKRTILLTLFIQRSSILTNCIQSNASRKMS